jgi:hypothetical protein
MRTSFVLFCVSLAAAWATNALAQVVGSIWEHNGSQVYLYTNGAVRQFHYATPAPGLIQAGVQSGTLLFNGRQVGDQVSGTAYVFSSQCGAIPYVVAGLISADSRWITLQGKAPVLDWNCSVVGYRDDTLVFNFISIIETSPNQGQIAARQDDDYERQRFLEQWQICFHAQDASRSDAACAEAQKYPHLNSEDWRKLYEQRGGFAGPAQKFVEGPIDPSPNAAGSQIAHEPINQSGNMLGNQPNREASLPKPLEPPASYVPPTPLDIPAPTSSGMPDSRVISFGGLVAAIAALVLLIRGDGSNVGLKVLTHAPPRGRATVLAVAALISAILSDFGMYGELANIPRIWGAPPLPGLFFGLVLAAATWLWASPNVVKSAHTFLFTLLAWILAVKASDYVRNVILREVAHAQSFWWDTPNYINDISGVLGGLVGGSIVALSFAIICKEFRVVQNWASIVMPATVLGVLLECADSNDKLPIHIDSFLPLFLAWQTCVAAVIAYRIVPRSNSDELLEAFNQGLLGNSGISISSRYSEELPANPKPQLDKEAIKKNLRPRTEEFEL